MAFFGTYIEVTPHSRLVWTNEEGDEGSLTTVTFEEKGGRTLLVMHELYPSKEALDAAGTGAADAMLETFDNWTSFSSPWARATDGHEGRTAAAVGGPLPCIPFRILFRTAHLDASAGSLHCRPALEDDLGIGGIHPVAPRVGVPGDQVAARDAAHDLVRARHDAGERGARPLPVAGGELRIQDERRVREGQLGDLAQQPAAVRAPDGVQHLAQLAATQLGLVRLVQRPDRSPI